MHFFTSLVTFGALVATTNAAIKGFNYGAQFNNDQAKLKADFEYEFNAAKNLPGTNGWTSARLYTMIQHNTQSTIIEAIEAAINTKTTLLLGLWASAGAGSFSNEITALKSAIAKYGTAFTDLVVGISVGSEDLYRITPTGIDNNSGAGAQPQELINYVRQTREAIKGTALQGKPIGHVDTWTVYVNATNNDFIASLDFVGVDAYPYFQTTMANSIGSASQLFFDAYHATVGAAQGKPVWVTETGWPISGKTLNKAEASATNARMYWEDVTCQLVADNVNLYYYTLQDVQWGNPVPSFGIKPGGDLQQVQPLFDLSCPAKEKPSSSSTRASTSTKSSTGVGVSTISRSSLSTTRLSTLTSSTTRLTAIPTPSSVPTSLRGPFEAPNLIVPVDKANPSKVVGNSYTAQLSPSFSTVFVFDVRPEQQGKTCNLVFFVPPAFPFPDMAPVKIRSPGGIAVSRVNDGLRTQDISADNVGPLTPVGGAASIQFFDQYTVGSAPCEAGQKVAYQVDSNGGLVMDFFQMTSPPLGLFMIPT